MLTKTEFAQRLTKIISATPCNKPIRQDYQEWLLPLLRTTSAFGKRSSENDAELICCYRKFGPRRQKFLAIRNSESGKELVVAKGKLLQELYPTKSNQTPEQKHRSAILAILRKLIEPQIQAFRKETKKLINQLSENGDIQMAMAMNRCALSNRSLNSCKTAVDHAIPFIQLVEQWLELHNFTYADIKLKGRGSNRYFAQIELMDDWCEYHSENAKLQMVCSSANSSAGAKGYISKQELL